jgi:hypothetical protein
MNRSQWLNVLKHSGMIDCNSGDKIGLQYIGFNLTLMQLIAWEDFSASLSTFWNAYICKMSTKIATFYRIG